MIRTTALALAAALALAGCSERADRTGPGRLSIALEEAPASSSNASLAGAPRVDAVLVQVLKVRAHAEAGWVEVSDRAVEVNLLDLPAATVALGLADLPAGKVTQIRLLVAETGNRVLTATGELPLVVPSGVQSGIKIHGPWHVTQCDETAVTLEFDGKKSLWYHPTGQGSPWILRPVIHAKKSRPVPGECGEEPACNPQACPSGLCDPGGACAPGGTGVPCDSGEECLSGTCVSGGCQIGGPGEPCRVHDDCESGVCDGEVCDPGGAGGGGAACTVDGDCLSNACVNRFCEGGGQGSGCESTADCMEGFSCTSTGCQAP